MYKFAGLIIGVLVGYNASGITFDDIHNAELFAQGFSGRGNQVMYALGMPSEGDLVGKLAMYVLGFGILGMVIGGFVKSNLNKNNVHKALDAIRAIKDVKTCPNCAENIKSNAKVCRYCNCDL